MSLNRGETSKNLFSIINKFLYSIDRKDDFDIGNCYLNYSESEKKKSSLIKFLLSEKSISNEIFICYELKGNDGIPNIYFIVNDNEDYSDEHITKQDADIIDLLIMSEKYDIQIASNKNVSEIYDRLFVYDDLSYTGHTFSDLVDFFEPFSVYKLERDSLLNERHLYSIYAFYLLKKAENSTFSWEKQTLEMIKNVIFSESDKIPFYNIILLLSSRQWRHIFLESYRIIEHLFSITFLKEVSDESKISALELAKTFENILKWRPPEEEAIKRIFSEVEENNKNNAIINDLIQVKNSKAGEEALYKWYYKEIRNQIAHFRIIHENIDFSDKEWNIIIRYNFFIIYYMYNNYNAYIIEIN